MAGKGTWERNIAMGGEGVGAGITAKRHGRNKRACKLQVSQWAHMSHVRGICGKNAHGKGQRAKDRILTDPTTTTPNCLNPGDGERRGRRRGILNGESCIMYYVCMNPCMREACMREGFPPVQTGSRIEPSILK